MRAAQFTLSLLLLASNAVFADWQLNLTPGVTPVSHDIYDLHMTIFWICVVIGLGVFGVMFYSIIHHRKSKGAKPAQFHEHLWLEISWSIIPLLILIAMAVPATKVLIHLNDQSEPDLTVKITGHQWKWEYTYMDQGIHFFSNLTTPYAQIHNLAPKDASYLKSVDHPMVVPIHKKIRFLITSGDVIHTWFVPDLGVQRDAVPGFMNESWTRINRAGTYYGQCDKLCGINHAYMPIVVVAMSEKDFANWVAVQKGEAPAIITPPAPGTTIVPTAGTVGTPTTPKTLTLPEIMQRGEQIYLNTCSVCHQPSGEGMPPTFPSLKGSLIATGPVEGHLNRVLNGKPGTAMQAFKEQLTDDDLAAVITYERNAWGNNKGDMVTPEQVKAARAK